MSLQHARLRTSLGLAGLTFCAMVAIGLVACGGGGGTGAGSFANSTGTITAFGSVFVNGHEFATTNTRFVDDDDGGLSASGLEVGMVVDVTPSSRSSTATPEASELHLHPLARGYVDAIDSAAGTLTVMGQTVQVTAATHFSDHRACLTASPTPCAAVTGASLLSATTSASGTTTPGSYVTVHGYLFSDTAGSTNIVATLVAAADLPSGSNRKHLFKVEGPLTLTGTTPRIGGLTLDWTSTVCRVKGVDTPCASAFSAGQVLAVGSATAPTLPATSFAPEVARLTSKTPVETAGQTIELEGVVSAVNSDALTFVVRGMTVNASGLGSTLPAVGDLVEVYGTVGSDGQSLTATRLKLRHAAASRALSLQGDVDPATLTGSGTDYRLTLLGQEILVNAQTRMADMSLPHWDHQDPATNPFNSSTFADYLRTSASKHLIVRTTVDTRGPLTALSVLIVPASNIAAVSGVVDATPAVYNSNVTGTPSTFAIHGVAVSADPAAISRPRSAAMQSVTAGDLVTVVGSFSNNVLSVAAPPSRSNYVLDLGVPQGNRGDRSDF